MNEFLEMILSNEEDYNIKMMLPPYRYALEPEMNTSCDVHCAICGRLIGINEFVHQGFDNKAVCTNCHKEHILPVNISTIMWHQNLNLIVTENFNDPEERWLYQQLSNPLLFTEWLNNQNMLKNEFFMFSSTPYKNIGNFMTATFLPQGIEIKALNHWFENFGINKKDCTFRTLDTFPNFKGRYENILVIYNSTNMMHFKKDGSRMNMVKNPFSYIFGEQIVGDFVLVNFDLVIDETFDANYRNHGPHYIEDYFL